MIYVHIWPVSGLHAVPQIDHASGRVHFGVEQLVIWATPDLNDRATARAPRLTGHIHGNGLNDLNTVPSDHALDMSHVMAVARL
eukprot:6262183-Pyramimonas_sp.AAC.1